MRTLYKYYPANENSLKSLSSKGFWCTSPYKQNDPNDCLNLMNLKFGEEELSIFNDHIRKTNNELMIKLLSNTNLSFSDEVLGIRNRILNSLCVSCFSEDNTNTVMWTHYASNHTGFVLEVEFTHEYEERAMLTPVKYIDTLPKIDIFGLADFIISEEEDKSLFIRSLLHDLSVKSPDWSYEKEWRIWLNRTGYAFYQPNQIKSVYFGARCDPQFIELVSDIINAKFKKFEPLTSFMVFEPNTIKLKSISDFNEFKKRRSI